MYFCSHAEKNFMKQKRLLLTLAIGVFSFFTYISYGQDPMTSYEQNKSDSIQKNQQMLNKEVIDDAKDASRDSQVKAKEAQRVSKEADDALRQSQKALKAEQKAQKARKKADKQAKKAEESRYKSDGN
jgi:hypothetical protein